MEECIFCKIARKDVKEEIIEDSENFIAFPDANPAAPGHTLIVPKRHFANLMDLPSDLAGEMIDVIKKVAEKRLREGAEGFNLVMNNFEAAGQVVEHAHLHLIPRKKGDKVRFNVI
jgi:histidine triad (HIT) family protein